MFPISNQYKFCNKIKQRPRFLVSSFSLKSQLIFTSELEAIQQKNVLADFQFVSSNNLGPRQKLQRKPMGNFILFEVFGVISRLITDLNPPSLFRERHSPL